MADSDFLVGIQRTSNEPKTDPGRDAPPDERRGLNVLERHELAKRQAREQGKHEPSFSDYAAETFKGANVKPKELEQ